MKQGDGTTNDSDEDDDAKKSAKSVVKKRSKAKKAAGGDVTAAKAPKRTQSPSSGETTETDSRDDNDGDNGKSTNDDTGSGSSAPSSGSGSGGSDSGSSPAAEENAPSTTPPPPPPSIPSVIACNGSESVPYSGKDLVDAPTAAWASVVTKIAVFNLSPDVLAPITQGAIGRVFAKTGGRWHKDNQLLLERQNIYFNKCMLEGIDAHVCKILPTHSLCNHVINVCMCVC